MLLKGGPGDVISVVSDSGIIGWGNGLSPIKHQAISWTSYDLLLIRHVEQSLMKIKDQNT